MGGRREWGQGFVNRRHSSTAVVLPQSLLVYFPCVGLAWVALLSIMSIISGPIFISAVSLPVAIFASPSAMSYVQYLLQLIFCLRAVPFCVAGFVVWLATACYAAAFLPVDRSYGAARLPHKFSQSVSFSSEVKHTSVL